jgi:hypothetical protein
LRLGGCSNGTNQLTKSRDCGVFDKTAQLTPDSNYMTFDAKFARSVFCLAVLLAWSGRGADAPGPAVPPGLPEGAKTLLGIAYVAGGCERQMRDLYPPATGTNWPLIVWIHGGGWTVGSKAKPPGLGFLLHGFAPASINYRLLAPRDADLTNR